MIAKDQRWIFVHIQKCGGNAVRTALGVELDDPHKHFFAQELREIYGGAAWRQAFKFSFVRNPWDRLVSWWSMIDANRSALTAGRPLNRFYRFILERASTFEEFLEYCDEDIIDSDGRKWIYRNQLDYLMDSSGELLVDFVGRFETLDQDFAFVAQKITAEPAFFSRVNRSTHRHYSNYFTPALVEKVARRYSRDIEAFGYEYGA